MLSTLIFTALSLAVTQTFAQSEIEMADTMRAEGKIYVVVAILTLILAGLIVFLISMDRKVRNLEGRLKERKQCNHSAPSE